MAISGRGHPNRPIIRRNAQAAAGSDVTVTGDRTAGQMEPRTGIAAPEIAVAGTRSAVQIEARTGAALSDIGIVGTRTAVQVEPRTGVAGADILVVGTRTGVLIKARTGTALATANARFVTAISANGRYFVDQLGDPIFVHADTPWALILNLDPSEQETYFANREANGFNAIGVSLTGSTGSGGSSDESAMYDGVKPFTSDNIATPNATYWGRVDDTLSLAESRGITVFAYAPDTFGYQQFFIDAGASACETFGEWLGDRYGSRPNLVWMAGGDYDPVFGQADEEIAAIHDGIKTEAPAALWAMNWNYYQSVSTDLDSSPGGSLPDTWARDRSDYQWVYSYSAAYDKIRDAYAFDNRPVIFGEGRYEDNNTPGWVDPQTPEGIRRQWLWTITSGGVGHWYGRERVWQFEESPTHWNTLLDSDSVDQLHALRDWLETLAWWTLIPDTGNTFLTGGQGSPTSHSQNTVNDPLSDQYVTAAKSADNLLAVVYVPATSGSKTITVDKDQIAGTLTALWVDPSDPSSTSAASFSGDNVTTPSGVNADGENDWVLLLEGTAANITVTGTRISLQVEARTGAAAADVAVVGTRSALQVEGRDGTALSNIGVIGTRTAMQVEPLTGAAATDTLVPGTRTAMAVDGRDGQVLVHIAVDGTRTALGVEPRTGQAVADVAVLGDRTALQVEPRDGVVGADVVVTGTRTGVAVQGRDGTATIDITAVGDRTALTIQARSGSAIVSAVIVTGDRTAMAIEVRDSLVGADILIVGTHAGVSLAARAGLARTYAGYTAARNQMARIRPNDSTARIR